jgi:hypothetical protein
VTDVSTVFNVAGAIILSVGGAGLLITGLSSWLGRVWATRIADEERGRFAKELEGYKSELHQLLEERRDALTRRRDVYARLVTSMRVFIGGPRIVSDDEKQAFLVAFDHAALWASEEVVKSLGRFLEISVVHAASPQAVSNDQFKDAYRACVEAIRRDCGFPETEFKYPVIEFH